MATRAIRTAVAPRSGIAAQVATRWPELLAIIVVIESVAAALLANRFHLAGEIPWTAYYLLWLIPAAFIFVMTFCAWLWKLYRSGEEHPARATLGALRATSGRTYIELVVPIVAMAPFMASFTTFKVLLANVTAFTADPALARLDEIFGIDPWRVSHALIGPFGTVVLDRLYFSWFLVSQFMLMAVLFVPRLARQRAQVLLTFVLAWIVLGTITALLIPSVGPCYYARFYHPDHYADLMARLGTIDQTYRLTALDVQKDLWADHARGVVALGSGISAMPSMHVSIATITALLLRRLGWGWLGWLWLGAIWIGSFHLGWHYASDGIVSVAGTMVLWKLCSVLLAQGQPQPGRF